MIRVPLRVTNCSMVWYASKPPNPINLSYHILRGDGGMAQFDGRRTALVHPLAPAAGIEQDVAVEAPAEAGAYLLVFTVVQEEQHWFDQQDPRYVAKIRLNVVE